MYDLYKGWRDVKQVQQVQPVKFNMYRTVFKTDFNIAVPKPRNDRCDLCEQFDVAKRNNNVSEPQTETNRMDSASKNRN